MINRNMMSGVMGLMALLSLSGCGSPVSVKAQHAQEVDFASYKTYTWHPQGMNFVGIPVQRAQLAQQAIKSTVDRELSLKGIKPATFEAPSFFITSTVGAVNLSQVKKWGQGTGGFTPGKTDVALDQEQVREGTIVLDFVDNKTGELIWRATAHGAVEANEDPRAKVEGAVRSMLNQFPPR
jgi:hypothetical protein